MKFSYVISSIILNVKLAKQLRLPALRHIIYLTFVLAESDKHTSEERIQLLIMF